MKFGKVEKHNIVDIIRSKLRILNLTILLSITIVLLLVAKFTYSFLGYLGMPSVLGVLFMVSVLAVAVFYISGNVSRMAIRSIEDYHDKLDALSEISRQVHEIDHTDELMDNILASALELTGAEGGSLLREEEDTLRFDLVKGCCTDILTGLRMPRKEGIAGWVMDKGRTEIVNNAADDPRHSKTVDEITGFNTNSVLCAPIKLRGEVIGAVELVSEKAMAFNKEDAEMMECFLAQAAFSMTRARYREDMRNYEIHLTNILVEAIENVAEKNGHLKRVAKYALMIGHALKMNDEGLRMLHRSAMLHDIGFLRMKIHPGMPEREYNTHAVHGYEILKEITFYKDIATIVLHHHERYDGKGQPEGIAGEEIPLMSRIISIAEVFDVMTNKNPFNLDWDSRGGFNMPSFVDYNRALLELQGNAGRKFDPALVSILVNNINEDDVEWRAVETCIQTQKRRRRDRKMVA